jgi:hypothetical protein
MTVQAHLRTAGVRDAQDLRGRFSLGVIIPG